jgi:putative hydrolase of the HAD superfamily
MSPDRPGPPVAAVTFDLDDTLFTQAEWLAGAWDAVADAAPGGVDRVALRAALDRVAAEGSDRGAIVDRALAAVGHPDVAVGPLVDAFHRHRPARLTVRPGATDALARLRARVPVGLVSDGDVGVQLAKLRALGLADAFDVVVLSDRFGRAHRKPSSLPFRVALGALGAPASRSVHVGDRPAKDVLGAWRTGMAAVRVRTGEYAAEPDPEPVGDAPLTVADDVVAAIGCIERWIERTDRTDRTDRTARIDRSARIDRTARNDRTARTDRGRTSCPT